MRTVLGVAGGIAAYKAGHIIRRLRELDHSVKVVPTANALSFVGAPTFEALSGQSVTTDVFDEVETVNHVRIGQEAELVIIAPATANLIAKIAAGMADDLLTATVLTTTAEVVVAPACTRRCGTTRPPWPISPPCALAESTCSTPPWGD